MSIGFCGESVDKKKSVWLNGWPVNSPRHSQLTQSPGGKPTQDRKKYDKMDERMEGGDGGENVVLK